MLLPAGAYITAIFYNKPKIYMTLWFVFIGLFIVFGDVFKNYIAVLDIDESRMSYFTAEVEAGKFSRTGFRWDFLLYGSIGVFAGWYYTFKKKIGDKMYARLFNTFLIANSFWILVNTANFSDRFAYLSWFIMPLLIIYPLLKVKLFSFQHKRIGFFLLLYYGFTFTMFLI